MNNGLEIAAFYRENMALLDKYDPSGNSDTREPVPARELGMTAWGHPIVKVDLASFQSLAASQATPATTPSLTNSPELTAENLSTISRAPRLAQLTALVRDGVKSCLAMLGIKGQTPSASTNGPHTGNAGHELVGACARAEEPEKEKF